MTNPAGLHTVPRMIGCYRCGNRWLCFTADDLAALLRLADDGLPVELVGGGDQGDGP